MLTNKLIYIVEDEPALAEILRDYFLKEDARVELMNSGLNAVEAILVAQPDLVVLDIMLPDKDGLEICRELRAKSPVPIILESARVEELDRLLGLELGADDYVCKPWSPREIVARARALLRRSTLRLNDAANGLLVDWDLRTVKVNGHLIDLTRREFDLFTVLYQRPHMILSRTQLADLAFPEDTDVRDRTIDSHVRNIRAKFRHEVESSDIIRSVYGVGYSIQFDDILEQ